MIKYKITNQDLTTYNRCQWVVGVEKIITKGGNQLCSGDVFHFYDSPEIAVLMNPTHGDYKDYKLWEIECDEVAHDGLKGGSKRQKLIREIPIPTFTVEQRIKFGILCVKQFADYKDIDKDWNTWADNWLSGVDRTMENAKRAGRTKWAESVVESVVESVTRVKWVASTTESVEEIRNKISQIIEILKNDLLRYQYWLKKEVKC